MQVYLHIIFSAQEAVMQSIAKSVFTGLVIVVAMWTSGCANLSARDRNTITGAGVGAVAGSILTGGAVSAPWAVLPSGVISATRFGSRLGRLVGVFG